MLEQKDKNNTKIETTDKIIETLENFIYKGSATKSPMLEYIDLGVKRSHLIIGHTHLLMSKWGYHFLFKHFDVFTSC